MSLVEPNKDFHIQELHLQNFKCFEDFTIQFPKRFTVLVGDNGSGKTTVLEGVLWGMLRRIADFFVDKIDKKPSPQYNIPVGYVRLNIGDYGTLKKYIPQYPCKINCNSWVKTQEISWENECRDLSKYHRPKILSRPNVLQDMYLQMIGGESNLPLIAYYKTNRLWDISPSKNEDLYNKASRLSVYQTSLNADATDKNLLSWFKRMALVEFQEKIEPPELAAVKKAVLSSLQSLSTDGKTKIYYSAREDDLLIDIGDGLELPLRMLSDGYRNTLGMIADIAYRMAELNPHITTDSPGIVLIDELDLHLHPKWQKHIVHDLKTIFPNLQFITTTHSPFIIQSLEQGELVKLGDNDGITGEYSAQSIEDIAENVQDVPNPQWSEKRKAMFEAATKYYQALHKINKSTSQKEITLLKAELDRLSAPYADNIAYYAFLQQERLMKEFELSSSQKNGNNNETNK
ncbi:MAG: AAA family ATPase [Chitinophagales bacterium]